MAETIFSNESNPQPVDNSSQNQGEKKQHKYLKPLLVILAVILLVGGTGFGVWYWQNGEIQKQKTDSDKRISELQKQINDTKNQTVTTTKPTESTDETANWKTYTDKSRVFSIKYPTTWVYMDNYEVGNGMVAFADNTTNLPAPRTDEPAIIKASVSANQERDTTCPEKIVSKKFTTKSGLTGNTETMPANSCSDMFGGVWKWTFASIPLENGQYLNVTFVDKSGFEDIYNKMLETIELK